MFHVKQKLGVSDEVFDKLLIYHEMLKKWQKAINLVSNNSLASFWDRHVLDSLQVAKYIEGKSVLDVGSGGGFPGMVLAILGEFDVTCLDSDSRKMMFLSEVARVADVRVRIITKRLEEFTESGFDTVCARGFSSLSNLLEIVRTKGRCGVFLKGSRVADEIREAQESYKFNYELHESVVDSSGVVIKVSSVESNGSTD